MVEKCAYRMTSPGIGAEAGASLDTLLEMYQGFFISTSRSKSSSEGCAIYIGIFRKLWLLIRLRITWALRTDLIQSVNFLNAEQMIAFCKTIQQNSPINAQYAPEPSYMPGYSDDVIMAAGTFIQGSSIELTADGPISPPYTAYIQGGLTYEHVKAAVHVFYGQVLKNEMKTIGMKRE